MNATFIKEDNKGMLEVSTENTGDNIMCDFVNLTDGKLMVITFDSVYIYNNREEFENGNDYISYMGR